MERLHVATKSDRSDSKGNYVMAYHVLITNERHMY